MENQENKSNWDDLARQLGAEVRPDEPPAPPAPADAVPESYSYQRAADKPRTAPPKKTANWGQLNAELGLPPVEEPPPPEPPRQPQQLTERLSPEPSGRTERSREDR